ncbi:MAG: M15 family metallopeptidase [Deltaproteobacteria bacterium]|nr:M15 family metallopeptidase [Deltaproteobacteria bacterium]
MRRRDFLKTTLFGAIFYGYSFRVFAGQKKMHTGRISDDFIRDYLQKMEDFDKPHPGDVYLDGNQLRILQSSLKRLTRLQRIIGYGNFHLLSFDEALKLARNYSRVGRFTKEEIDFLEWIFYRDAAGYGFLGNKPMANLTDCIQKGKVKKIPGTGNYLYKGRPLSLYLKLRKDVGKHLILTSGVRSIMKQTLLFLNKANRSKGNLSLASRSLAPPGFSYHAVGDFDVGQIGYGVANFTERFTRTRVFQKLSRLNYITLRYSKGNFLGVRFEPWHIKVVSSSA